MAPAMRARALLVLAGVAAAAAPGAAQTGATRQKSGGDRFRENLSEAKEHDVCLRLCEAEGFGQFVNCETAPEVQVQQRVLLRAKCGSCRPGDPGCLLIVWISLTRAFH